MFLLNRGRSRVYIWAVVVSFFAVVHGWLFLWYKHWLVLGFDTGFYRRYLIEPLTSIPHASVPGLDHTVILPRVFLDVVRLSGLPTDVVLYGSYWLAAALLLWSFWWWVKEIFDRKTAYLAVLLVLLSPVYFHAYWYFLLKNFLALALFFWMLIAIRRQWWGAVLLLSVCLPITHQSTTVITGFVLFVCGCMAVWRRERWQLVFVAWAVITAVYLLYHPTVAAKLAAPPRAFFLELSDALWYLWPLLLVAIATLVSRYKILITKSDLLSWLIIVGGFITFSLPYHERLYFSAVFPLAIIVACGMRRWPKQWQVLFIGFSVVWWGYIVQDYTPYFSRDEAQQLESLALLTELDHVLTPNFMAPWVHGYSRATVYAPGVFKDQFDPTDWELYWSHSDPVYDQVFLDSFPPPLYLYVPSNVPYYLPESSCVSEVSQALYRYECYGRIYEEIISPSD